MKQLLLLPVLLILLHAQQIIEQSLQPGGYRSMKKQDRSVPRLYICGAGVWKRKEMVPSPNHCYTYCNRKRKWYGKSYCSWETKCNPVPPKLGWIRVNGIRFQYCHFQHWNQQVTMEESGNWDWQGMSICPENQYVYGFRLKLTERDGLAGLILLCRNMRNFKEASEKLVFDGEGNWNDPIVSGNFAVGFKAKFEDWFINGLALEMAAIPYIFAFNFNYQFLKDFNAVPIQIDSFIVVNNGPTQMRKEVLLSKQKRFQRIWQNQKGYLHGVSLSNSISQSLSTTIKVGIPFLSSQKKTYTSTKSMTQALREQSTETFKFGVVQTFTVSQKQKDVMFVPSCTKFTIKQIVYSTDTDVPYKLEIGYTNGAATEFDVVHGWYRGVTTGEAETAINYEKIC